MSNLRIKKQHPLATSKKRMILESLSPGPSFLSVQLLHLLITNSIFFFLVDLLSRCKFLIFQFKHKVHSTKRRKNRRPPLATFWPMSFSLSLTHLLAISLCEHCSKMQSIGVVEHHHQKKQAAARTFIQLQFKIPQIYRRCMIMMMMKMV